MPDDLIRQSVGLSPVHIELIRLLAEIAVNNFLAEGERDGTPEVAPADDREGMAACQ